MQTVLHFYWLTLQIMHSYWPGMGQVWVGSVEDVEEGIGTRVVTLQAWDSTGTVILYGNIVLQRSAYIHIEGIVFLRCI